MCSTHKSDHLLEQVFGQYAYLVCFWCTPKYCCHLHTSPNHTRKIKQTLITKQNEAGVKAPLQTIILQITDLFQTYKTLLMINAPVGTMLSRDSTDI